MEAAYQTWLLRNHLNDTAVRREAFAAGWRDRSIDEVILPIDDACGLCPVCDRVVVLNEDGTLWYHFGSPMNQDDPIESICSGSNMFPRRKEEPTT